jgi:hypothetical protein
MSITSLVAALAIVVSPVHIRLVFAPGHHVPPAAERAAVAEAAAIWEPYGVVVTTAERTATPAHDCVTVTVVMNTSPAGADETWRAPLGAVDFDGEGAPIRVIRLFIARLLTLLESAHMWDVPASQWPRVIRDGVVGRAIGRVLAHEIGHVLLRTTDHTARGLMRAVQYPDELIDPARSRYTLQN